MKTPSGYRKLRYGEKLKKGDMLLSSDGKLYPTMCAGMDVTAGYYYRKVRHGETYTLVRRRLMKV